MSLAGKGGVALLSIALGCGLPLMLPPAAPAARPLATAIDPSAAFSGSDLGLAYERIRQGGASSVKIVLSWKEVAPASRPAGFDAGDPSDPHYDWDDLDKQVRFAVGNGLEPFITIDDAPSWAERGQGGRPGTNNPDPAELALFAQAAARRYSGDFGGLPRVRKWEAWNEPNGSFFLYPQRSGSQLLSPDQYRRMVNAFAGAIHGVHPDNEVVAGALFPFTVNRSSSQSIGPLQFMRALFCMTKRLRPMPSCAEPVHFDVWSHHPYTSGGPTHLVGSPDTVSIRQLPRMARLLRAAERAGRVVSSSRVRFWVTEFSWDSDPPDPGGVPARLLTRWVSEGLYRMWRSGVSLVTWFKLRDDGGGGQPDSQIFQSGLYFRCLTVSCDRPKPSLRAFRFPFVAFRSGHRVYFWGRTPGGKRAKVIVQQLVGKRWRRLRGLKTNRFGIFSRRVRTFRRGRLRVLLRDRSDRSAAFSLTRPPDLPVNPFG